MKRPVEMHHGEFRIQCHWRFIHQKSFVIDDLQILFMINLKNLLKTGVSFWSPQKQLEMWKIWKTPGFVTTVTAVNVSRCVFKKHLISTRQNSWKSFQCTFKNFCFWLHNNSWKYLQDSLKKTLFCHHKNSWKCSLNTWNWLYRTAGNVLRCLYKYLLVCFKLQSAVCWLAEMNEFAVFS